MIRYDYDFAVFDDPSASVIKGLVNADILARKSSQWEAMHMNVMLLPAGRIVVWILWARRYEDGS